MINKILETESCEYLKYILSYYENQTGHAITWYKLLRMVNA